MRAVGPYAGGKELCQSRVIARVALLGPLEVTFLDFRSTSFCFLLQVRHVVLIDEHLDQAIHLFQCDMRLCGMFGIGAAFFITDLRDHLTQKTLAYLSKTELIPVPGRVCVGNYFSIIQIHRSPEPPCTFSCLLHCISSLPNR